MDDAIEEKNQVILEISRNRTTLLAFEIGRPIETKNPTGSRVFKPNINNRW